MTPNLQLALQITLIGMSLVFGAIVLFWGLMSLLVRVTTDPAHAEPRRSDAAAEHGLRQRAAAAALALALAEQAARDTGDQPNVPPPPPTAIVSAWQAVMRANQLSQRGPVR